MLNTIPYILFSYISYCFFNQCRVAELGDASQLLSPKCLELGLDFAEHQFYRVVLWAVAQIVDPAHTEAAHLCLCLLGPVGREVVQEYAELLTRICVGQALQVLLELGHVDRIVKNLEMLVPFLFADAM